MERTFSVVKPQVGEKKLKEGIYLPFEKRENRYA